jgi:hypothetical protein
MARRTAEEFLLKNGASRLGTSCFVEPNATCPVCKAGVFFYANSDGSRVFFDDLGPPWPKHPCTDRPRVAARIVSHADLPERRKIGIIREIAGKAWILDRSISDIDRTDRPSLDSWRLLTITKIHVRKGSVEIDADFLETIHQHQIKLTTAVGPHFYIGQFASLRYDLLSFIDESRGRRVDVTVAYRGLKVSNEQKLNDVRSNKTGQKLDRFGLPVDLKTEGIPGPMQRSDYIGADPSSEFFENVKVLILAAANEGAKYLADFLIALSDSKLRPLRSIRWTRDIVSGVIYDIRNQSEFMKARSAMISQKATERGRLFSPHSLAMASHQPLQLKVSVDREKTALLLREVEDHITEFESAWDSAIVAAQRQKIRDQLDAARRKRAKLLALLSS